MLKLDEKEKMIADA